MFQKPKNLIALGAALFTAVTIHAQGFVNLNFESATIPAGTPVPTQISLTEGVPGWSESYTTGDFTELNSDMYYDGISGGGNFVAIIDKNEPYFQPLNGKYSAILFSQGGGPVYDQYSQSISQTALVPSGSQSLVFNAYVTGAPFVVTLGGQTINLELLQIFGNYTEFAGTIPPSLAGQSETLEFTELPTPEGDGQIAALELDNISFSPNAVPEPSALAFGVISGFLFGVRGWFRKR
jgi:hypothetical protein